MTPDLTKPMRWKEGEAMIASKLDNGRCCGRKPIFYKGGSWRSPKQAPMHFCDRCHKEYGPDGVQRENWAWKLIDGSFRKVKP
mgnify:CR=1 FL=1